MARDKDEVDIQYEEDEANLPFPLDTVEAPGPYLAVDWPEFFELTAEDGEFFGEFSKSWLQLDENTGAYAYQTPDGERPKYLRVTNVLSETECLIADGEGTQTLYNIKKSRPFSFAPLITLD